MLILDSIKQLETEVKGVRGEKRQIEEKYNALLTDMESIQDHRKRIEASYQEEVEVLNNKIAQLNDYVEDLESKYNKKVKEYISPIAVTYKLSTNVNLYRNPEKHRISRIILLKN